MYIYDLETNGAGSVSSFSRRSCLPKDINEPSLKPRLRPRPLSPPGHTDISRPLSPALQPRSCVPALLLPIGLVSSVLAQFLRDARHGDSRQFTQRERGKADVQTCFDIHHKRTKSSNTHLPSLGCLDEVARHPDSTTPRIMTMTGWREDDKDDDQESWLVTVDAEHYRCSHSSWAAQRKIPASGRFDYLAAISSSFTEVPSLVTAPPSTSTTVEDTTMMEAVQSNNSRKPPSHSATSMTRLSLGGVG